MQPNWQPMETDPSVGWGALLAAATVWLVISLAIMAVVCFLLYTCFKRIPPQHRKMEPSLVWLLLIPLFNLVWNFFVFLRLPESYNSYFATVGQPNRADTLRTIGLVFAIVAACSIVPCINVLAGPAALVLLIIFLVQAWSLKNEIPEAAS